MINCTHIIFYKPHLVFSIEKNKANIGYLKNNSDKEFLIFTNDLYKHYKIHSYKHCKIQWIGFNKNDIDITITIIMNKNLYSGSFLDSYPKLAVGFAQTLCNVANFMIGYNLEILEITSGNSPIFSVEKNERNIKYLTDNFDKEFHIFVNSYLYKCYRIQWIRFNENDITIVVDEFEDSDNIVGY